MTKLLLALGADPRAKTKVEESVEPMIGRVASGGDTPLHEAAHFAAEKKDDALARLLLAKGADAEAKTKKEGYAPLHYAAFLGSTNVVKLLLAQGVELDARSAKGETPLHLAAWLGPKENVSYLLERGADPSAKTKNGKTPLDLALERHRQDNADILRRCYMVE